MVRAIFPDHEAVHVPAPPRGGLPPRRRGLEPRTPGRRRPGPALGRPAEPPAGRAAGAQAGEAVPAELLLDGREPQRQVLSGERPSLAVNQQLRATGFGGCNNFSATLYPLRQQGIAVGPFALTKKSCDKGVMARELEFLTALRTAAQWDLVGPNLVIKGQHGELKFERSI
jgi:heat shock protein HslJ